MRIGQRALTIIAIWVLLRGIAGAQGFDEVLSSKHNVLAAGPDSPMETVCGSCHIKGSAIQAAPAWDPANPTKAFQTSPVVRPPLGKGTPDTKPFGPSFDCLTCHDGVLGSNIHQVGFSGEKATYNPKVVEALQTGLRTPDHPDSIRYPREPNGQMTGDRPDPKLLRYWSIPDRDDNGVTLPTGPRSAALNVQNIDPNDPAAASLLVRTYKGVIHCDSCHNPHDDKIRPFLRLPLSSLCLVCHDR